MKTSLSLIGMILCSTIVLAHQPVMDMAPRWEDGYGFQVRQEKIESEKLLNQESKVPNSSGSKQEKNKTWIEGIYTFKRWIRLSFKLPKINQNRTIIENGKIVKKKGEGFGDLVIGLPLKDYTNKASSTGNVAFTPSIRLPTGSTEGDFPVSDGSLDFGFSFSKSLESEFIYQLYDLFYWVNGEGKNEAKEGNEIGLDINVGLHPYHHNLTNSGVFVLWDISARHKEKGRRIEGTTGGTRITSGPILMLYRSNLMVRASVSFPVYEYVFENQFSSGRKLDLGIGITF